MNQTSPSLGSTIAVELSELGPLADQLNGVAGRYEETGAVLAGIRSQLALLASLDASGNGAQALASLGVSSVGLFALVAGTRRLSQAVSSSAQAYADAEAFALIVMSGFTAATGRGRSAVLAYSSLFGYRVDSLKIRAGKNGAALVHAAPKNAQLSLDLFRKTWVGCLVMERATSALNHGVHRLGMTGRLRAMRKMTGDLYADETEVAEFMGAVPTTPQGVARRVEHMKEIEEKGDTYMAGQGYQGEWDHVVVEKLVNPTTGETMYLVTIPGTDGDLSREKPGATLAGFYKGGVNSWPSTVGTVAAGANPDLAPEDYTALMSLVDQAMQDTGVPEGATVSLMGFSQGATAASSLANNRAFNSRYRVKGLVTQAGPVDHIKVREDIVHIDLRHKDDYVPLLSGDRLDYRPDESYIYTATPASGDIHGAQEYREMADAEPQAQQSLDGLEKIFSGYVSVNAGIYSGTSQKPGITKEEQAVIGVAGTANVAGQRAAGVSLDINPAALYQDTQDLVHSAERGLGNISIGGVEIFDPILEPLHPNESFTKPPVPAPDDKIKVYEATLEDHLDNLGDLLGVPDPWKMGVSDSIQIFEPERELAAG